MREQELVRWLSRRNPAIGDDTAELALHGRQVVTVDSQIEGIHFPAGLDEALIARRLARVNLSDIAASGAQPSHALCTLAAPRDFDHRRFLDTLVQEGKTYGFELVGGDSTTASTVATSLSLIGTLDRHTRFVGRGNGEPGDVVWVGGPLGMAGLGLYLQQHLGIELSRGRQVNVPRQLAKHAATVRRAVLTHRLPQPQLELGRWLGRRRRVAAIDVSDGLGKDLGRMCEAGGHGAVVDAASLPLPRSAKQLAEAIGLDSLELATGAGEDYVLLFALPRNVRPPASLGATAIGHLTETTRVLLDTGTELRDVSNAGYDHLE